VTFFKDAIRTVLSSGAEVPSRNGGTREVLGASFSIQEGNPIWIDCPTRKWNPVYAAGEALWYLSGDDSLRGIAKFAPSYSRFSDDKKTLHGAYGPRIWKSMRALINELHRNPDSRRAVIPIWSGPADWRAIEDSSLDIPCTVSLQFLIREGRLIMFVNMRSNDVWLGLPNDVFAFRCVQYFVADSLAVLGSPVEVGAYYHSASSLHIYDQNRELCEVILGDEASSLIDLPFGRPTQKQTSSWQSVIYSQFRRIVEKGGIPGMDFEQARDFFHGMFGEGSLLSTLFILANLENYSYRSIPWTEEILSALGLPVELLPIFSKLKK
jgi:thymidylate synthase